jgi:hypothetical protein
MFLEPACIKGLPLVIHQARKRRSSLNPRRSGSSFIAWPVAGTAERRKACTVFTRWTRASMIDCRQIQDLSTHRLQIDYVRIPVVMVHHCCVSSRSLTGIYVDVNTFLFSAYMPVVMMTRYQAERQAYNDSICLERLKLDRAPKARGSKCDS